MWMAYFCRQGRITKYPVVPSQCAFKSDPPRCIYFSLEKKKCLFLCFLTHLLTLWLMRQFSSSGKFVQEFCCALLKNPFLVRRFFASYFFFSSICGFLCFLEFFLSREDFGGFHHVARYGKRVFVVNFS